MTGRIVITGGTGCIGTALCRNLAEDHEVVVVSRSGTRRHVHAGVHISEWDARSAASLTPVLEGARAVVNLAGENIAPRFRWNAEKERRILQSRLAAAGALREAVAACGEKPAVVVQASAIGIYGNRGAEALDEHSGLGTGFLARVAQDWESAGQKIADTGVRLAVIRTGVVLGPGGGMLTRVLPLFRVCCGGHPGNGWQWVSWIHLQDEVRAIRFLIERHDLEGAFNLTAPHACTARDFYTTLGNVAGRPAWLLEAGFAFSFPDLWPALEDVLHAGKKVGPLSGGPDG